MNCDDLVIISKVRGRGSSRRGKCVVIGLAAVEGSFVECEIGGDVAADGIDGLGRETKDIGRVGSSSSGRHCLLS